MAFEGLACLNQAAATWGWGEEEGGPHESNMIIDRNSTPPHMLALLWWQPHECGYTCTVRVTQGRTPIAAHKLPASSSAALLDKSRGLAL